MALEFLGAAKSSDITYLNLLAQFDLEV